jgi:hypothetical protein
MTILFFIALAVVPLASAKNKKKQPLPNYVLKAQTVAVVIPPEAGEPLTSPAANRTAQVNVMNECIVEMMQIQGGVGFTDRGLDRSRTEGTCEWPNDPQFPRGLPTGYPRWRCSPFRWRSCPPAGVSRRSPDLTNPGVGRPSTRTPNIANEAGMSEDSFEVYMGGVDYPLDAPPVWRYVAKDALNSPQMTAVQQFRNAVNESDQLSQQKP